MSVVAPAIRGCAVPRARRPGDLLPAPGLQEKQHSVAHGAVRFGTSIRLANISHELRTPLNGIIGTIRLALGTQPTAEQREYLRLCRSSARVLLAEINKLLDLSKAEAGRVELERTPFALRPALDETVRALEPTAREKALDLRLEISSHVPDTLVGDSARLRQILTNLIANAIKFTDRGRILVTVGLAERAGNSAVLHVGVEDTGVGIPADQHEAIFEPFAQASGASARRGGTGLGLAISRRLVELMGGRIWVESEPGCGSRFQFTARFGVAAAGIAASAPSGERPGVPDPAAAEEAAVKTDRPLRILVVEDNPINLEIAVRLLESWGHRVSGVASGRTAIERVGGGDLDLVFMDVQMPDIDGLAATREIRDRELGRGTRVPIVAMTAYAMPGDRDRCLEAGMDGYVTKPIEVEELLRAIERFTPRPALDRSALSDLLGHSARLQAAVTRTYLEHRPQMMADLRAAVTHGDPVAIEAAAHTLKGAVGNLRARPAFDLARRLETMARRGELAGAEDLCAALEQELDRLQGELAALG